MGIVRRNPIPIKTGSRKKFSDLRRAVKEGKARGMIKFVRRLVATVAQRLIEEREEKGKK